MNSKLKIMVASFGAKGGVGKTFLMVLILDILNRYFDNVDAYDTDSGSPVLSRYPSAKARHIRLFNVDEDGEIIAETEDLSRLKVITSSIERATKEQITLVDNGSSSFYPFLGWFDGDGAKVYHENYSNFQFVCIIPVTALKNTHESANTVLSTYGKYASYIIVENEFQGKVDFTKTPIFQNFVESGVAFKILNVPKFTNATLSLIERVRDNYLMPSEAMHSELFDLIEKSRLNSAYGNFEKAFIQAFKEVGNV